MFGRAFASAVVLAAALTGTQPAMAECKVGRVLELPVTMRGLQPTVGLTINGKDARFAVDSGAFFSMISPGSAAELGLRLRDAPDGFRVSGIGGETKVSLVTVDKLGLGTITLPKVEFIVGGSEVGSVGLLGQNVLGVADVEYDLAGGALRLMRAHGCEKANLAYWIKPGENYSILPIDANEDTSLNRHTTGIIRINGARVEATFDTGAATSVLTLAAARRLGLKIDGAGAVETGSMGGLGRKFVRTWIVPVSDLVLGDEEIKNARIRVSDIPAADFDMLIGADFFLSHRVYVSNANRKLYFSYGGGPVFNLTTLAGPVTGPIPVTSDLKVAQEGPDPTDAGGWSRRAASLSARRDVTGALVAIDKAIALAPNEPRYYLERAHLKLVKPDDQGALADLDRALVLQPDQADALLLRAGVKFKLKDKNGARSDLDRASKAVAPASDMRLEIGSFYEAFDAFDASVSEVDLWLKYHPDDNRVPMAYNQRCWARALGNRDLPKAVSDCNAAIRARPKEASFLDSLGLVLLRSGKPDAAIATYNRALALDGRLAWSLYGRGLARVKLGQKAAGEADIAAATAMQPSLPEDAKRYGITS